MYDCKGRLEMHMHTETVARDISKWAVTEEAHDCVMGMSAGCAEHRMDSLNFLHKLSQH